MTNYISNQLVKYVDTAFMINPAYEDPLLAKLLGGGGIPQLDLRDVAINQQWVQFSAIVAKAGSYVSDYIKAAGVSDAKDYQALRKGKVFGWGIELNDMDYRALLQGTGAGAAIVQQKIAAQMQTNRAAMMKDMAQWAIAYLTTFTSLPEYDPEWIPLFHKKPATGTVSDPEDIASTPGTADAYAFNFTSTNKSKDFIQNTFGASIKRFGAMVDSNTEEGMLKPNGNKYTFIMNPDNVFDFEQIHPYNGVQDDQNISYMDQITKIGGEVYGSKYVDAAQNQAEDGTNEVVAIANVEENFKLGILNDYTIEPWEKIVTQKGDKKWYKGAWFRVVPFARPWYINGSWKKAMHHFSFVYKNDAG